MPENKNKAEEIKQASTNDDEMFEFKIFLNKKKAQNKALKKLFDNLSLEQDQTNNN